MLLDKSVPTEKNGGAQRMVAAGITTLIDRKPTIAHNKVMVIDGATVLTGSFNWTASAEKSNAENLLVLRRPALAEANTPYEMVRYPTAGHGFHCDRRSTYDRQAATDAWSRTLAWLEEYAGQ